MFQWPSGSARYILYSPKEYTDIFNSLDYILMTGKGFDLYKDMLMKSF